MCDTLWKHFDQSSSVFLKNSDRSANEPNLVVWSEARNGNGPLNLTYITIDDAPSFSCILYKPSWTWGAEMGINEKGVAIGNEAVFTRSSEKKVPSIIGMDYIRLGLERGASAKEAMEVIINLLRKHGQGGNCGYDREFYYDNSYLICDAREAYLLETAGYDYAVKKLEGQCNISNRLSLESDYDFSTQEGNFAQNNTEGIFSFFSGSSSRKKLGEEHLSRVNEMDLSKCLDILRVHEYEQKKAMKRGNLKSVCMHAGNINNHSTGSFAVFYKDEKPYVFATGSSTPCISLFKPIMAGFESGPLFTDPINSYAFWLKREKLNRAVFSELINLNDFMAKAKAIEASILKKAEELIKKGPTGDEWKNLCLIAAYMEESFMASYDDLIRQLDGNPQLLVPYWMGKTNSMKKKVFERELRNRK